MFIEEPVKSEGIMLATKCWPFFFILEFIAFLHYRKYFLFF